MYELVGEVVLFTDSPTVPRQFSVLVEMAALIMMALTVAGEYYVGKTAN